jgi:hypothetical protein
MAAHRGRFVAYFRVSTDKQGKSGLGLDAQRKAVRDYLNGGTWTLIGEFTEVERGKRNERPELVKALAACKPSWSLRSSTGYPANQWPLWMSWSAQFVRMASEPGPLPCK